MPLKPWAWVLPVLADVAGVIAVVAAASLVLLAASRFVVHGSNEPGLVRLDDGRTLPFKSPEEHSLIVREHAGHVRGEEMQLNSLTPGLLVAVLAVPLGAVASYVLIVNRRQLASWFRPRWTWIFVAFGSGVVAQGFALGYVWIAKRLGFEPSGLDIYGRVFASRGPQFVAVSLIPVFEELYFRGRLFGLVEASSGTRIAIGVTSVAFAVAHSFVGLAVLPAYLAISVVLGWLRARSGGLLAPIAGHIAVNASAIVALVPGAGG